MMEAGIGMVGEPPRVRTKVFVAVMIFDTVMIPALLVCKSRSVALRDRCWSMTDVGIGAMERPSVLQTDDQ